MKHILESQQFSREYLDAFFLRAEKLARLFANPATEDDLHNTLSRKSMCEFFSEPSTRTFFSFSMVGHRLGMFVASSENADQSSSLYKGESLKDTTRIIAGYGFDVMVMRNKLNGASKIAAAVCDQYGLRTRIVNAGDGTEQHPTQALLDLFTIWMNLKERLYDRITVAIGGDLLRGRTVRSLAYLLERFNARIIFVSPRELAIPVGIKEYLTKHGIEFREETSVAAAIPEADVVYWTRTQNERNDGGIDLSGVNFSDYVIDTPQVRMFKPGAILMHPMPIAGEITEAAKDDPHCVCFDQAWNGLPVRAELLLELFGQENSF
jgi:aspartate carbamoyltransferase catalytic subunit